MEFSVNCNVAPLSRNMAEDRCGWAPGRTEIHSCSHGLKEAQVQACLDQPEPGQDLARGQTVLSEPA